MSHLGYVADQDVPPSYQEYRGSPVSNTLMSLFISVLLACGVIVGILAFGTWLFKKLFREQPVESYLGRDDENMKF